MQKLTLTQLKSRFTAVYNLYKSCILCPHRCGIDRTAGELGICGQDSRLKIASAVIHRGEEPPLDRGKGVGNIFLTGCSMNCVYCQNYQASQENMGEYIIPAELGRKMVEFQTAGAAACGWVTPAHFVPGLLKAWYEARKMGFRLPLIYNTSGYENIDTLKILEGVVDIYLADLRYSDSGIARKYSGIEDYAAVSQAAVEEMFRQTGAFRVRGRMRRGVIIRLLVLPADLAGLWETMCFIALELSKDIPISLMSQYLPVNRAGEYAELNRPITTKEYEEALRMARELGFRNIFAQEIAPEKHLVPDFGREGDPFGKG